MVSLEDVVAFCKRRGFVYQSSMLYGGLKGFFDYGPLGVELKNNIKKLWWKDIVYLRDDVYGMDCSNVINKAVLYFSGHQTGFEDVFLDCKQCKCRFRDDEISELHCPKCGSSDFSEPRSFKLMMNVNVGPVEGEFACLRPETAQSMFINFKNICDSFSPKLPFGIAQVGKAYRNEVTPKNFIFRSREFEQMEMEFFVKPEMAEEFFIYWRDSRFNWWKDLGLDVQLYNQNPKELAHYSKATSDIYCKLPHGYDEVEGVANRADFDLGSHTKGQNSFEIQSKVLPNNKSTEKLNMNIDGQSFIPHVIEVSAGVDRMFFALICNFLSQDESRVVLRLPYSLAPIKVAVIALIKSDSSIVAYAKDLVLKLKQKNIFPVIFEASSNIGKIYKKHDEIGTPFCVTVDPETFAEGSKNTVTVRHRDTKKQIRLDVHELCNVFK